MAGLYTVTIVNGGCSTTYTVSVVVNQATASASSNSPLCSSKSLNLSATGGGTYSWSGPNSFTNTNQNPIITNAQPLNTGIYSVTVTSTNGCTATATTSVVISQTPIVGVQSNSPTCSGGSLNLSASGGLTYSWSGPGAFTSTDQNPVRVNVTTSMSGVYSVTVQGNGSCTSSSTISVVINPNPTVTATSNGQCVAVEVLV
ncbi:MAG: hypothetical protein U0Y10_02175 [Spirosomataceae bacterium]